MEPPYTDEKIYFELRVVAPPGYSRHQTGYAIDLASGSYGHNEFEHSEAYAWLTADNFYQAKRHGFVPSYPAGVENQGPDPEAWEFIYVGVDYLVAAPSDVRPERIGRIKVDAADGPLPDPGLDPSDLQPPG